MLWTSQIPLVVVNRLRSTHCREEFPSTIKQVTDALPEADPITSISRLRTSLRGKYLGWNMSSVSSSSAPLTTSRVSKRFYYTFNKLYNQTFYYEVYVNIGKKNLKLVHEKRKKMAAQNINAFGISGCAWVRCARRWSRGRWSGSPSHWCAPRILNVSAMTKNVRVINESQCELKWSGSFF